MLIKDCENNIFMQHKGHGPTKLTKNVLKPSLFTFQIDSAYSHIQSFYAFNGT